MKQKPEWNNIEVISSTAVYPAVKESTMNSHLNQMAAVLQASEGQLKSVAVETFKEALEGSTSEARAVLSISLRSISNIRAELSRISRLMNGY